MTAVTMDAAPASDGTRRMQVGATLLADAIRPAAPEGAVRARLEISVDVVEIEHDVLDLAEGRHVVLIRRGDVLAAVDDDLLELVLRHLLQRIHHARGIGASGAVGTMAAQAGFGIAPPAVIGSLVDLAVLHRVGLILGDAGRRATERRDDGGD